MVIFLILVVVALIIVCVVGCLVRVFLLHFFAYLPTLACLRDSFELLAHASLVFLDKKVLSVLFCLVYLILRVIFGLCRLIQFIEAVFENVSD